MLPFSPVPTFASDLRPSLITFGPSAAVREGDHDYGQLIHVSVPEGSGRSYFRVFDADVGGAFDERYGAFDTKTSFKLYGAGASSKIVRDENGIVGEKVSGKALEGVVFGNSKEDDNAWRTVFAIDAERGELKDGQRHFLIDVRGVAGNDGNVFSVGLTTGQDGGAVPKGSRLYSNLPTFQVPRGRAASGKPGGLMSELRFTLPKDAKTIAVENFDAAGAKLYYAGPFNSIRLTASGTNDWQRDTGRIDPNEAGKQASITVANGYEKPNDMTVFVGVSNGGVDPVTRPLGIDLPLGVFAPNKRPKQTYTVTALGCQHVAFDASGSFDPDGQKLADDSLRHSWVLRGGLEGDAVLSKEERAKEERLAGERVERKFATPGIKKGRLESFDRSGLVGSGTASDFEFLAKAPPVASFTAPSLVGEGETFRLDGSSSKAPELPPGTKVLTYRWEMGDGRIVEQGPDDNDFGKPEHRYDRYGNYTIGLTVTDTSRHPCRTATTTKTITVNAPPTADAGGDRGVTTGQILTFDGSASTDRDGQIAVWQWDFPDGRRAFGRKVRHAFHKPGDYTVKLTVLDDTTTTSSEGRDAININVTFPANKRPIVSAGSDRTVELGQAVWFDGSASKDEDGNIQAYAWDFGDGSGSNAPRVEHTFWKVGQYPVSLTVTDDAPTQDGVSVKTSMVTVLPASNRTPLLDFPNQLDAFVGETLRLDARSADDRDGSIIQFEWTLGNGEKANGPVVDYIYDQPGTYKASIKISDNGFPTPETLTKDFVIQVRHRPNAAPKARSSFPGSGETGTTVVFDASQSTDRDGSILSYEWDFGDGQKAAGIRVNHIYQFEGDYKVTLTVTDDGRKEDRKSDTVNSQISIALADNQRPVAEAGVDLTAVQGEPVRLDGSQSTDPDGLIQAYLWTFGDGTTSFKRSPLHTFHDPGTYRVELRVTDNGQPAQTAVDTMTVIVTPKPDGEVGQ